MIDSRILRYASLVALTLACAMSKAEEFSLVLEDLIQEAHAIAWVRITDRRPVEFTFENQTLPCGFLYTAIVSDSTRGSLYAGESFEFFSEYEASLDHGPRDYFAVVFRNDPARIPDLLHLADRHYEGRKAELMKCRARAEARADYRVPAANEVAIAPAIEALSDRSGAPWFERNASNILHKSNFAFISYERDGATLSATSWDEIKRVLPRPKRRWGLPSE